jgi:exopolyphosphatase/guanosine-5'-triphosphate,3'-diphosphate pyrophosphatase
MTELNIDSFNLAAIDVGSNAARLLIKHVDIDVDGNRSLNKLLFLRIPLRLGMDVFGDGRISKDRGMEFLSAMKAYRQLMKVYHVRKYRACATSAMRDAKNGKALMKRIKNKAHVNLEIISGDEESGIIYDNHLANLPSQGAFLYVDVGGGSTEISFICNGQRIFGQSFNVGTIRLLKGKVKKNELMALKTEVTKVTSGYDNIKIIGSGGNINKLFRLANKKRKLEALPVEVLRKLYDSLSKMSVEERMVAYELKPDRADVIVPAAEIFLHVAASSKAKEIIVPNFGLADGIINDLLLKN